MEDLQQVSLMSSSRVRALSMKKEALPGAGLAHLPTMPLWMLRSFLMREWLVKHLAISNSDLLQPSLKMFHYQLPLVVMNTIHGQKLHTSSDFMSNQ